MDIRSEDKSSQQRQTPVTGRTAVTVDSTEADSIPGLGHGVVPLDDDDDDLLSPELEALLAGATLTKPSRLQRLWYIRWEVAISLVVVLLSIASFALIKMGFDLTSSNPQMYRAVYALLFHVVYLSTLSYAWFTTFADIIPKTKRAMFLIISITILGGISAFARYSEPVNPVQWVSQASTTSLLANVTYPLMFFLWTSLGLLLLSRPPPEVNAYGYTEKQLRKMQKEERLKASTGSGLMGLEEDEVSSASDLGQDVVVVDTQEDLEIAYPSSTTPVVANSNHDTHPQNMSGAPRLVTNEDLTAPGSAPVGADRLNSSAPRDRRTSSNYKEPVSHNYHAEGALLNPSRDVSEQDNVSLSNHDVSEHLSDQRADSISIGIPAVESYKQLPSVIESPKEGETRNDNVNTDQGGTLQAMRTASTDKLFIGAGKPPSPRSPSGGISMDKFNSGGSTGSHVMLLGRVSAAASTADGAGGGGGRRGSDVADDGGEDIAGPSKPAGPSRSIVISPPPDLEPMSSREPSGDVVPGSSPPVKEPREKGKGKAIPGHMSAVVDQQVVQDLYNDLDRLAGIAAAEGPDQGSALQPESSSATGTAANLGRVTSVSSDINFSDAAHLLEELADMTGSLDIDAAGLLEQGLGLETLGELPGISGILEAAGVVRNDSNMSNGQTVKKDPPNDPTRAFEVSIVLCFFCALGEMLRALGVPHISALMVLAGFGLTALTVLDHHKHIKRSRGYLIAVTVFMAGISQSIAMVAFSMLRASDGAFIYQLLTMAAFDLVSSVFHELLVTLTRKAFSRDRDMEVVAQSMPLVSTVLCGQVFLFVVEPWGMSFFAVLVLHAARSALPVMDGGLIDDVKRMLLQSKKETSLSLEDKARHLDELWKQVELGNQAAVTASLVILSCAILDSPLSSFGTFNPLGPLVLTNSTDAMYISCTVLAVSIVAAIATQVILHRKLESFRHDMLTSADTIIDGVLGDLMREEVTVEKFSGKYDDVIGLGTTMRGMIKRRNKTRRNGRSNGAPASRYAQSTAPPSARSGTSGRSHMSQSSLRKVERKLRREYHGQAEVESSAKRSYRARSRRNSVTSAVSSVRSGQSPSQAGRSTRSAVPPSSRSRRSSHATDAGSNTLAASKSRRVRRSSHLNGNGGNSGNSGSNTSLGTTGLVTAAIQASRARRQSSIGGGYSLPHAGTRRPRGHVRSSSGAAPSSRLRATPGMHARARSRTRNSIADDGGFEYVHMPDSTARAQAQGQPMLPFDIDTALSWSSEEWLDEGGASSENGEEHDPHAPNPPLAPGQSLTSAMLSRHRRRSVVNVSATDISRPRTRQQRSPALPGSSLGGGPQAAGPGGSSSGAGPRPRSRTFDRRNKSHRRGDSVLSNSALLSSRSRISDLERSMGHASARSGMSSARSRRSVRSAISHMSAAESVRDGHDNMRFEVAAVEASVRRLASLSIMDKQWEQSRASYEHWRSHSVYMVCSLTAGVMLAMYQISQMWLLAPTVIPFFLPSMHVSI